MSGEIEKGVLERERDELHRLMAEKDRDPCADKMEEEKRYKSTLKAVNALITMKNHLVLSANDTIIIIEEKCCEKLTELHKKYIINKIEHAVMDFRYGIKRGSSYVWKVAHKERTYYLYKNTALYIMGMKDEEKKRRLMIKLYRMLRHDRNKEDMPGWKKDDIAKRLYMDVRGFARYIDSNEMPQVYFFLDEALK